MGNYVLEPDGVSGYIQVASSTTLDSLNFSVGAWIKESKGQYFWSGIVDKGRNLTPTDWYLLTTNYSVGQGQGVIFSAYSQSEISVTWSDSNWHYVVGTYDGTNERLYLDGSLKSGPTAVTRTVKHYPVTITALTASTSYNSFLPSNLAQVTIYNFALSSSQVAANYSNPSTPQAGGLVLWYNFNVTNYSSGVADLSAASNSAVVNGSISYSYDTTAPTVITEQIQLGSTVSQIALNQYHTQSYITYLTALNGYNSPTVITSSASLFSALYAAEFNGDGTSFLSAPSSGLPTLGAPYSVFAWIKASAFSTNNKIHSYGGGLIGTARMFQTEASSPFSTATLGINVEAGDNGNGPVIYPNVWNFVGLVTSSDGLGLLYYNGVSQTPAALGVIPGLFTKMSTSANSSQYVGADRGGGAGNEWIGEIGAIYVYNRAVAPWEEQVIYFNPSNPPTSGLVTWYQFNAQFSSGSTITDYGSSSNNATVNGNVSSILDPMSPQVSEVWYGSVALSTGSPYVATFDGASTYIQTSTTVSAGASWSMASWVNLAATKEVFFVGFTPNFSLGTDSSNHLWVDLNGTTYGTTTPTLSQNSWHHVAASYASSSLKLYIDGVLQTTTSVSIPAANGQVIIGNWVGGGNYFVNGKMAQALIWNTNLSTSQIVATYSTPNSPALQNNLVGWWNLNQNWGLNGGTVTDNTANLNNGVLAGVVSWTQDGTNPLFSTLTPPTNTGVTISTWSSNVGNWLVALTAQNWSSPPALISESDTEIGVSSDFPYKVGLSVTDFSNGVATNSISLNPGSFHEFRVSVYPINVSTATGYPNNVSLTFNTPSTDYQVSVTSVSLTTVSSGFTTGNPTVATFFVSVTSTAPLQTSNITIYATDATIANIQTTAQLTVNTAAPSSQAYTMMLSNAQTQTLAPWVQSGQTVSPYGLGISSNQWAYLFANNVVQNNTYLNLGVVAGTTTVYSNETTMFSATANALLGGWINVPAGSWTFRMYLNGGGTLWHQLAVTGPTPLKIGGTQTSNIYGAIKVTGQNSSASSAPIPWEYRTT